jgi:hypothetical protein
MRVHGPHEEVAGRPDAVTGEHPPGPIGPVRRRREPDDQNASVRVPEPGHWLPPVLLVPIRGFSFDSHAAAVRPEPLTAVAADDLMLHAREREWNGHVLEPEA